MEPAAAASSSFSSAPYRSIPDNAEEELSHKKARTRKEQETPQPAPLPAPSLSKFPRDYCDDSFGEEDDAENSIPSLPVLPVPDSAELLYLKKQEMVALAQRNEWKQVLALYPELLREHPQDLELLELKGVAHYFLQQWSEVLQCAEKILTIQPRHDKAMWARGDALKKRALSYATAGHWDAAIADYLILKKQYALDQEMLNNLAICYTKKGEWENALSCYKGLIEIDAGNLEYWKAIGFCCMSRRVVNAPFVEGEADLGLRACQILIASYPDDLHIHMLSAHCTTHLRQLQQADQFLDTH